MDAFIRISLLLLCTSFLSCAEDNVGIDTDADVPTVISTAPGNGAVDVPLNIVIQAAFSENLNASTVNDSSFRVNFSDSLIVQGNITVSSNTATFTPRSPLQANTRYTVTLTSVIEDLDENQMGENYTWTFTTANSE